MCGKLLKSLLVSLASEDFLLQIVNVSLQFGIGPNLLVGCHDGGVISVEELCNVGIGHFGQLTDEVDAQVPRLGNIVVALFASDILLADAVLFRDRFDDKGKQLRSFDSV